MSDKPADAANFLDMRVRNKCREQIGDWSRALRAVAIVVDANQLGTVDEMIFRGALLQMGDISLAKDEIFLAIPFIEALDVPVGGAMKIALFLMRPEFCDDIQDFRVLEMDRPEILA